MTRPSPADPQGHTLSLLWLFACLNILFRDVHELSTASAIKEVLSGVVGGNPVTEAALLAGAFAVELLLLGFLLSALLPGIWARRLNLVLSPVAVMGMLVLPPSDPDDVFFAIVTFLTFASIFVLAWRWRPAHTAEGLIHAG